MNKIYYYEIQEKSKNKNGAEAVEETKGTGTIAAKTAERNLVFEYDKMENDEFEMAEQFTQYDENVKEMNETFESFENSLPVPSGTSKLVLNLDAMKISLKAPNTPNEQMSLTPNVKVEKLMKKITTTASPLQQRAQHVPPLTFTIQPIKDKSTHCLGEDSENVLPEIVLTPFESRGNVMTATNTTTSSMSTARTQTPTMENYNHSRRDSENSSEMSLQPNCYGGGRENSTSPESLMDNILSAASSVSLCEIDTNSSAAIPIGGTPAISLNSKSRTNAFQQEISPLSPRKQSNATTPVLAWLQPPHEQLKAANMTPSRSPSPTPSIRIMPERALYPDEVKCTICLEPFRDPRTLNCLHSFCLVCLVSDNVKHDQSPLFLSELNEGDNAISTAANEDNEWNIKSNYRLRSSSPEAAVRSQSEQSSSPSKQRHTSFSFLSRKSQERLLLKETKLKFDSRASEISATTPLSTMPNEMEKGSQDAQNLRFIVCKICNYPTALPIGGARQLPKNFILLRKIEEIQLKIGDEVISKICCNLCFEETNATYHCITCCFNLCKLCKDAHERQKPTANHKIKNIMELRRTRKNKQNALEGCTKISQKCGMHPDFELKFFCIICLQTACPDCLLLFHKGHRHEHISKASATYLKILNASIDQARPLCSYAEHSIERLSGIAKDINSRCDEVLQAVEIFIQQYFEALEAHRKTLLNQIARAREAKIEMVLEQQLKLERNTNETMEAVKFAQEICELASDVEVLSFVKVILKRLEHCQQKTPVDPKISESLHFLPKIAAPQTKEQNNIILFGIITMQMIEPANCALKLEDFKHLRIHKPVELLLLTRDADGVPLCHGGMLKQMQVQVKYTEGGGKPLPIEISDKRDGTYIIAFTPDSQGALLLSININEKPIKGSPYSFQARALRPHSGIFHCCSFCSSSVKFRGSKSIKCSCGGKMPGYNGGCGHGHPGHPGRRHWSCCGNVLENSECNVSNKLLN